MIDWRAFLRGFLWTSAILLLLLLVSLVVRDAARTFGGAVASFASLLMLVAAVMGSVRHES